MTTTVVIIDLFDMVTNFVARVTLAAQHGVSLRERVDQLNKRWLRFLAVTPSVDLFKLERSIFADHFNR